MNFTSVKDCPNPRKWVEEAIALKNNVVDIEKYKGKTIAMLFFNPSLRTRLSTHKAALNLGMNVMVMNMANGWQLEMEDGTIMNMGKAEHVKEAAQVIAQYCDVLGIRTFPDLKNAEKDYQEQVLSQFKRYSTVPVVSLESSTLHPLQSLTDMITIAEHQSKAKPKVVLTWAPHPKALPQAVANSFLEWSKACDLDITLTCPKGMELADEFTSGVPIEYNQAKAFENADFIYTKNWSSYKDYGKRGKDLEDWIVNEEKMKRTNNAHFMHCLPVRRNVVVADAVIDSPQSLVIKQSANRVFAAQKVLMELL